jgi:ABC-type transport system substrate-binding protein
MQLQSNKEALKERETAGINKTLLSYNDFRKAISLSFDRAVYNKTCTTSSRSGFGLFNSMHYYDVANGGVYRNEDVARQVLCDVYGLDASQYGSLEEAEEALTGYDLEQARALMTSAYEKALADGKIKATDKVELAFGTGAINESTQRAYDYLAAAIKNIAVGTPLEGRIETKLEDHGSAWANDFRAGAYDICTGGWSGAAWDPGYFLLAYLSPAYMYSTAWDTSSAMLTYTPSEEIGEQTMSLISWYACLNGDPSAPFNWAEGFVSNDVRLGIIAALEKEILSVYYTVPLQNYYSASLLSYKVDYVTQDYNTFMGYGGIRYMTYNYSDEEWVEASKNLDYTI